MPSTFRAKLMLIVGVAVLAFVGLVSSGALITHRVEGQLATIEKRYLPRVELEPLLQGQFERIQRAFQDAVAIRDQDVLASTRDLEGQFFADLDGARDAVEAKDAAALRDAMGDYYSSAYDLSHRMIAGETGEQLVAAVAAMQDKQARVQGWLAAVALLDRRDLTRAFSVAAEAERSARMFQLGISLTCTVLVFALSLWLSHSVVRSVGQLTHGFRRFGTGDFSQRISVASHDELELVANQANEMAASLEQLAVERERAKSALTIANRELEAFSYSVAHDLRAPLRGINGFSRALIEDYGERLDGDAQDFLQRIAAGAQRMGELIDALLGLARVTRTELRRDWVDLSRLADVVVSHLRSAQPDRSVEFRSEPGLEAYADPPLAQAVLENLLGNAWKFTGNREGACISFGSETRRGTRAYYVRDNGAGFDMSHAQRLFAPFQRLHSVTEFAGTGIGLATVQRIVHRHGGQIWAESAVGQGATFYFIFPTQHEGPPP